MGISANPPPQSRLPDKLVPDDELRGYFTSLQQDMYRLWLRSGGGTDKVFTISEEIAGILDDLLLIDDLIDAISADLILINLELIAINERIVLINARLDVLEARADDSDQVIAGLIASNGKIRALINTLSVFTAAEPSATYQIRVIDDAVNCAGTFTVTLPNISTAKKPVIISSTTGAITVAGDATIQGSTSIASGSSIELYPARSQWWRR